MVDLHSANYEMDPGVTRGLNLLAAPARAERFRLKIQPPHPTCEKGIARARARMCIFVASWVRVEARVYAQARVTLVSGGR